MTSVAKCQDLHGQLLHFHCNLCCPCSQSIFWEAHYKLAKHSKGSPKPRPANPGDLKPPQSTTPCLEIHWITYPAIRTFAPARLKLPAATKANLDWETQESHEKVLSEKIQPWVHGYHTERPKHGAAWTTRLHLRGPSSTDHICSLQIQFTQSALAEEVYTAASPHSFHVSLLWLFPNEILPILHPSKMDLVSSAWHMLCFCMRVVSPSNNSRQQITGFWS